MRDGLRCLVIECDQNQEASKKIALKSGFSYSGRLDNVDVYRLKLYLAECVMSQTTFLKRAVNVSYFL